eukprot:8538895-Pyramimonas_sp.AAC.1
MEKLGGKMAALINGLNSFLPVDKDGVEEGPPVSSVIARFLRPLLAPLQPASTEFYLARRHAPQLQNPTGGKRAL